MVSTAAVWMRGFGFNATALARTWMPRSDLCAGRRDDLAVAYDEGAVRLQAGGVGRERHGLSECRNG